ncbi:ionotropic receptor 93a-like [Palaemon carinicauda]|uniref:ionotropic receptor 93a-like n=1 Tax=Palaemon carinicauda TaxID=392227 RepID=UPI0035B68340
MSIVEDRFHAVDFSVPYFDDSYSFLLAIPEPPPRWHSIGFPFSGQTWIALVISIVTVCIVWATILKVNGQHFYWIRVILEVFRALLRQDPTPISSALSARLFGGMWWFVGMIISISYTGNLIAYITVAGKAKRLHTLKDLAQSDLRIAMIDYGNFVPGALRASQDETLRTIGEKLDLIPYDYKGALESVVEKKFSLVEGTEYIVYKVIKYKKMTNTYFLPEAVYPIYVGWTFPKKTAWKHKFDPYLQRMVEAGLCWHWKEVTVTEVMKREGSKYEVEEKETSRPLSLKDVQGIFLLYGIGLVFASLTFFIEITRRTFHL